MASITDYLDSTKEYTFVDALALHTLSNSYTCPSLTTNQKEIIAGKLGLMYRPGDTCTIRGNGIGNLRTADFKTCSGTVSLPKMISSEVQTITVSGAGTIRKGSYYPYGSGIITLSNITVNSFDTRGLVNLSYVFTGTVSGTFLRYDTVDCYFAGGTGNNRYLTFTFSS